MKTALFCLLLLTANAFGNDIASLESDPLAYVEDSVNVLTGEFCFIQQDLFVDGIEPLTLHRSFVKTDEGEAWLFAPHTLLTLYHDTDKRTGKLRVFMAQVYSPRGTTLRFRKHLHRGFQLTLPKGAANTAKKLICQSASSIPEKWGFETARQSLPSLPVSGSTQLRNTQLKEIDEQTYLLEAPDGTRSYYTKRHNQKETQLFVLEKEELRNGRLRCYSYDGTNRLSEITAKSGDGKKVYSWIRFSYTDSTGKKEGDFTAVTSDGQKVSYTFSEARGEKGPDAPLRKVEMTHLPSESFEYSGARLRTRALSGGRFLEFHYQSQEPKVHSLTRPSGKDGADQVTHTFTYMEGQSSSGTNDQVYRTRVIHADGGETFYHFDSSLLLRKVEYFYPNKELFYAIRLEWNSKGELIKKTLLNENETVISTEAFAYDQKGNPLTQSLSGILTESGKWETLTTHRQYDQLNRLIRVEDGDGKITQYAYADKTDWLFAEWVGDIEKIWKRTFYEYDEDYVLKRKIVDDGSTKEKRDLTDVNIRWITDFVWKDDRPSAIHKEVERFGESHPLQTTRFTYKGNFVTTRIYDEKGKLAGTWEEGNGKEVNPIGETALRRFDPYGNLLSEEIEGIGKRTFFYDRMGRIIEEKVGDLSIKTRYLSRKIEEENSSGLITTKELDCFGRIVREIHPRVVDPAGNHTSPTWNYSLDPQGNKTTIVDPMGFVTKKEYNVRGEVLSIGFPDGTKETRTYTLGGALKSVTNAEETKTLYTRDLFGRLIKEEIFSKRGDLLSKKEAIYDTFFLLSETDPQGISTYYDYDTKGRKESSTLMTEWGPVDTRYSYDSLGRLEKTQLYGIATHITYDPMDRIVEVSEKDDEGNIFEKTAYTYGKGGKLETTSIFLKPEVASTTTVRYDLYGRLVSHIDSLGGETQYSYRIEDHKMGIILSVAQILHPSGRETLRYTDPLGRLVRIDELDNVGRIVSSKRFSYTLNGDLASEMPTGVSYTYDWRGNLLTKTAGDKVYTYAYTPLGKLSKVLQPNEIWILYTYNPLGHLSELKTSDGTVHYTIENNALGHPTKITDEIQKLTGTRKYNTQGSLLKETFLNGQTLQSTYDLLGRRTQIDLPDGSDVEFIFGTKHLLEIRRTPINADIGYRHLFTDHNLCAFPVHQRLSHGYGHISYEVDKKMRIIGLKSNHLQQKVNQFDPQDRPCAIEVGREIEPLIPHDPVPSNQTSYTTTYDGLGRITKIEFPRKKIHFTYDFWDRQMTKKVYDHFRGEWHLTTHLAYLHDGEKDIGAMDLLETPFLSQLRVCADTPINSADNAIVYELQKRPYIPIHDLLGNTKQLISVLRDNVMETYTYTLGGQETILDSWNDQIAQSKAGNPWRYKCGRTDDETGLVYINGGYYDPTQGRFITKHKSPLSPLKLTKILIN